MLDTGYLTISSYVFDAFKYSFGGSVGTLRVINRNVLKHAFEHDFEPQKVQFGEPLGVPRCHFMICWEGFVHVFSIVFCCSLASV